MQDNEYIFRPDEPIRSGTPWEVIDHEKDRYLQAPRVVRVGGSVLRIVDSSAWLECIDQSEWTLDLHDEERKLYSTPEGIDRQITVAQEHHAKLQEFGATIPKVHYLLGPGDDGKPPMIYTVTDFVESMPVDPEKTDPRVLTEQMIVPLVQYYAWVIETRQPYFLSDLVGGRNDFDELTQNFSITAQTASIFLHDIEAKAVYTESNRGYECLRKIFTELTVGYIYPAVGEITWDISTEDKLEASMVKIKELRGKVKEWSQEFYAKLIQAEAAKTLNHRSS